jgi:hypothetical protein
MGSRFAVVAASICCLAVSALTAASCAVVKDDVNGEDDHFSFVAPTGSVLGEPLDLYAAHSEAAVLACAVSREGGCGTVAGGDHTPIAAILSAGCDGDACRVDAQSVDAFGTVHLTVIGLAATHTNLNLQTRLSDGREMTDRWPLDFAVPDHLAAYCDAGVADPPGVEACAGRFAIFPGATVAWRLRAEHAAGGPLIPLHTQLFSATVEGDAVTVVDAPAEPGQRTDDDAFPYWTLALAAAHPGSAVVHLAAGGITRDLAITVADGAQVVGVELRSARRWDQHYFVDAADDPTLGVARDLSYQDDYGYMTVLRLADGTRALGGAGFTAGTGVIYESAPLAFTSTAHDPTAQLAASRFLLHAEHVGGGLVSFDGGGVQTSWTFTVSRSLTN